MGEYNMCKLCFELWSADATQTKSQSEAIPCSSKYLESDSRVLAAAANLISRPEASSAIHPLSLSCKKKRRNDFLWQHAAALIYFPTPLRLHI
ncbi:hypothetical protein TNIN_142461 [Trichonephila inaurata madagascariensis]|uniref:Uncharacterized protein n=1 Tax=Trichonephila inaurata madagascariensis TaxID=2747483 RepID=A0A8X7CDF8_9ARAC|nr:hypothetical protein TNIN_142461 [Trichonephila inaurata madagascariensis]